MMMDGEQLLVCAENVRIIDRIRKFEFWQLFLQEQLSDQSRKFALWKFMTVIR